MGNFTRRDFLVKGGKYAIFTASAMQILFTSKRAMAQSGIVRFVISVDPADQERGAFAPTIARSPSATWRCLTNDVRYDLYSIAFEGNTASLPNTVPVTISWNRGGFVGPIATARFAWGYPNLNSNPTNINVPKTGATLGRGGTFNTGATRYPNRPQAATPRNTATGTVTFSAPGVQTLVITVIYP